MPTNRFNRDYLDPVMIDLFWQMLTERMRIYWRRRAGNPPPWTQDAIMRTEFITNVYRELDPGTIYLRESILNREDVSIDDKVFNVIIYRVMGSREPVHQAIGFQHLDQFSVEWLDEELRRIRDVEGVNPFGDAYRTAAYSDMGTKDKVTNVALLFGTIHEQFETLMAELRNVVSSEGAYNVLEGVRGFGDFLAYQIMVDLMYPAPFDAILPFSEEDWSKAGPGARQGAWQLLRPGMKPNSMLELMRWLRDNQHAEFARLGLQFPFLLDAEDEPIPISLCNIQSCLCEFNKYARIWTGNSTAVRRYNYDQPLVARLDEDSVVTVAKPSTAVGIGEVVVGAGGPEGAGGGEHVVLGGVALPGEVQLEGGGFDEMDEEATSPQAPAHDTGEVVDRQVYVLEPSGARLHDDEVRLVALGEAQGLGADFINAVLQRSRRLGLDLAEVEHLLLGTDQHVGVVREAGVDAHHGVHVMLRSDREITEVTLKFR